MRKWLATAAAIISVAAFSATASAGFEIGDLLYNPDLMGSGQVGTNGPFYVAGSPAWLNDANLVASMSSNIQSIPGFGQFRGTVDSFAYELDGGGLGLAYRIVLNANSAPRLVRASIGPEGWDVAQIIAAGADGSGLSANAGNVLNWNDGDPYFIARDAVDASPYWQFRFANVGTVINNGQRSALIWFETRANTLGEDTITLQDGGVVGGARILSVPEPASMMLLASGFGIAVLRRRLFS